MAGRIEGVTIEFRGDTTKLQTAINKVRKESRDTEKELKQIDKALKFNPTSVEMWRQKQTVLNNAVKDTEKHLQELKNAQNDLKKSGIDENSAEYMELQREILKCENQLKRYNAELRRIPSAELRAMGEQFKKTGKNIEQAGQSLKGFSAAGAATAAAVGALAYESGEWADNLNTLSKRYNIATDDLQKYGAAAKLVDVSVEDIASTHVKLEKSMASAASGSKKQTEAFEQLGINVQNADGSLRDADEVWQETIAALGQMENETERDALAMDLLGKSANALNPLIEDGGETYKNVAETLERYNLNFVDEETLARANEFNDTLDTMKAVGMVAIQNVGAQLAGYLVPALEKLAGWMGRVAEWLGNLDPRVLAIIGTVGALVAAVAPVLIFVGKLVQGIGMLMTYGPMIVGALGSVLAAIGPVILIIGALVAAGVLLYKNWDTIKAKALQIRDQLVNTWNTIKTKVTTAVNNLKTTLSTAWANIKSKVTTAWNGIKSAIITPIQNAYNTVRGWIQKLKNLFPLSIGKIFSNLKIPHINVSGGKAPFGIGGLGVKPSISVDWYDRGGIFRSPSIIGVGERRPEFVGALDDLRDIIREETNGGGITINVYPSPGMDVKALAAEVERRLIASTKRRSAAWQ